MCSCIFILSSDPTQFPPAVLTLLALDTALVFLLFVLIKGFDLTCLQQTLTVSKHKKKIAEKVKNSFDAVHFKEEMVLLVKPVSLRKQH